MDHDDHEDTLSCFRSTTGALQWTRRVQENARLVPEPNPDNPLTMILFLSNAPRGDTVRETFATYVISETMPDRSLETQNETMKHDTTAQIL